MRRVAPEGPVYQAGTLSGNPVACAAGLATLRILERDPPYDQLAAEGAQLAAACRRPGVAVNQAGSLLTLFFADGPVADYEAARRSDLELFAEFHRGMLADGVYLPPSQFEAWFLSTGHGEGRIAMIAAAARRNLDRIIPPR
jgi:glutamate-1-semialdehyde 2,1-aminomutase